MPHYLVVPLFAAGTVVEAENPTQARMKAAEWGYENVQAKAESGGVPLKFQGVERVMQIDPDEFDKSGKIVPVR